MVSTREQNPASQIQVLITFDVTRAFTDHGESSRTADYPPGIGCLDYLREGDTMVVRALDRLAGSEVIAVQTINELDERGIHVKSQTEPPIDKTTPMGRVLFGIVAVFAQLRADTIRTNTLRGLAHAHALGVSAPSVARGLAKLPAPEPDLDLAA